MYLFLPGNNIAKIRREQLFIQYLEGLHPEDAKLILAMKEHRTPWKPMSAHVARKAYPLLFPKQVAEDNAKAEKEAAYQAGLDATAAKSVREERDLKLKECDWVAVKAVDQNAQDSLGIQIPVVWVSYRQALRDITAQAGFPHSVTWPTKPE